MILHFREFIIIHRNSLGIHDLGVEVFELKATTGGAVKASAYLFDKSRPIHLLGRRGGMRGELNVRRGGGQAVVTPKIET